MLRQKFWLCFNRKITLNQVTLTCCKRHFSQQSSSSSTPSSNLPFKIIAGGMLVGGSTLLAYKSDFFKQSTEAKVQISPSIEKKVLEKAPVLVQHLPESVTYLIIGGGTAAFSASRTIRSNDPKSLVLIVTDEEYNPYMRPPLSKELWFSGLDVKKSFTFQQYNGRERDIYFEPEEFYLPLNQFNSSPNGGISLLKGHKVVKLDPTDRKAYLENGQMISYEKCLIATGGKAKNLPIFENSSPEIQDKVILFRNTKDFHRLEELFHKAKSVTIIGGGFLGSELAFALTDASRKSKRKIQLNQLFPEQGVLDRILPHYLSKWCTDKIIKEGVNVIPKAQVENVQLDNNQLNLTLTNGDNVKTDLCVVAVGLTPNTELAESAKLEVDDVLGGYRVNAELQIASNIWVAGDCSCFFDQKFGRRRVEHHDHAVVSGRLAGENMTGAGKPYWHQSMFWSDMGSDIGFEAIGVIDSSLPTFSVFAKQEDSSQKPDQNSADYSKGVVFYLKDDSIVGILMLNIYNNMHIARRIINDGAQNQDLNEVSKLFSIYELELTEDNDAK